MKRRRVLLGVVAGLGLAAAAGYVTLWATTPVPGVTPDNFEALQKGMTRSQVVTRLGEPFVERGGLTYWLDRPTGANIIVEFDKTDDRLIGARYASDKVGLDIMGRPPTIRERVRDWLGL